ncbi:MAG: hypothetical protein JNL95_03850 [Chitinophagales bacterium]|nr:hypothetical protein [Chitinophagales bacterium]
MINQKQPSELSNKQKEILNAFLKSFLPPTGTKRKNTANELSYIHDTVNRVLKQHFNFYVSKQDLLNAFSELEYSLYSQNGEWHPDRKDVRPSKNGNLIAVSEGYIEHVAGFLYVEVKANDVRFLMKATTTLPSKTASEKQEAVKQIHDKIKQFKITVANIV